jgi:hypothetical protein
LIDQLQAYFMQNTGSKGMNQMRRVCLVVGLLVLLVSHAGAWEFSLSGVYTWEFYQFSQLGANGFLGPFNQDESSVKNTVRLAARNGWLGHEITAPTFYNFWGDRLATGSDVAANYMYTLFYPKVKVNQALSLQGAYRIGAWNPINISDAAYGQLSTSRYLNSQSTGLGTSFSPGYWETWYAEAHLPWGLLTLGKAPNNIGLGVIIDSLENTAEAVALAVPFGPVTIVGQYYPWGRGRGVADAASNYPLDTDRSGAAQPHAAAGLMYNAGKISSQTWVEYTNGHKGPESLLYQPAAGAPFFPVTPVFATDAWQVWGFTNFKYFDGRFFFNTEVGFYQEFFRQNGLALNSATMTQGSPLPQTRYWELWAGMIECGAVAGPAKISFLWAYYPGPDRRGGKLIDRQPTVGTAFTPNGGVNMYLPYSFLLGYNYGSGNNSITRSSNHGYITDASTYGVRLDYAVAANLNVYATFLYADRVSQGYGWGWIRPDPATNFGGAPITDPALQYGNSGAARYGAATNGPAIGNMVDLSFAIGAPNILERDLGYEIGGGFDWKLIEGYTLTARVAYWKPGAWFKYACVDRRQPNWDYPDANNRWGINPDREIDPIFGMRVAIQANF